MSDDGAKETVVRLDKAKRDRAKDAAAALTSARTLDKTRIWDNYRIGDFHWNGKMWKPGDFPLGPDGILPEWSPVTPLGRDGHTYWFLDANGQILDLSADKCGKGRMTSLFACAPGFLVHAFPRIDKDGIHTPDNYKNESAMALLFRAADRKGPWSAEGRVRGRGCWQAQNGGLILHLGDEIRAGGATLPPGEYGGHVYISRPALPAPATSKGDEACGAIIHRDLMTWHWRRGETDARLMRGALGAGMIGGWLDWRPNVFLLGDKAVGKSQLQKYSKGLLGDFFVETHDATAAGLHQFIGFDSVMIGVDEMEAEAGSKKTEAVITLARRASSGGRILRGGANHKGQDFTIQSCFLFSAIAPPSMRGQDLSRLTLLELKPLKTPGLSPARNVTRLGFLGAEYLKRLMDWIARPADEGEGSAFDALLAMFRGQLAAMGHTDRSSLQFGTLLSCAWASEFDALPETEALHEIDGGAVSDLELWTRGLEARTMVELEGQLPTWLMCLNHLLLVTADPLKNTGTPNVVSIIRNLRAHLNMEPDDATAEGERRLSIPAAKERLAKIGLGLTAPIDPLTKKPMAISWANAELFIPKTHPEVARLFRDTDWTALGGAEGTWSNVLRQSDEDLWETRRAHIGDWRGFGVIIRLAPLFARYFDDQEKEE